MPRFLPSPLPPPLHSSSLSVSKPPRSPQDRVNQFSITGGRAKEHRKGEEVASDRTEGGKVSKIGKKRETDAYYYIPRCYGHIYKSADIRRRIGRERERGEEFIASFSLLPSLSSTLAISLPPPLLIQLILAPPRDSSRPRDGVGMRGGIQTANPVRV